MYALHTTPDTHTTHFDSHPDRDQSQKGSDVDKILLNHQSESRMERIWRWVSVEGGTLLLRKCGRELHR